MQYEKNVFRTNTLVSSSYQDIGDTMCAMWKLGIWYLYMTFNHDPRKSVGAKD